MLLELFVMALFVVIILFNISTGKYILLLSFIFSEYMQHTLWYHTHHFPHFLIYGLSFYYSTYSFICRSGFVFTFHCE
ncbi:hypothetical protein HanHA89_Chr13g0496401 [Helianthus annuus]|nr:hypothetical protein HanHA89_Chr13g0496401 [Helianthus annuus]